MPSAAQQLQELRETALSLAHSARVRLARELLESLEPENEEIDALWGEEAEKRFGDISPAKRIDEPRLVHHWFPLFS